MTYEQYCKIGEILRNRRPDQRIYYYYDCAQDILARKGIGTFRSIVMEMLTENVHSNADNVSVPDTGQLSSG